MAIVVLEDSLLDRLSRDPVVVRALPFIGALAKVSDGGCGSCGGPDTGAAVVRNAIKASVPGLPPDQLAKLKSFMGASQIRVYYNTGNGVAALLV